MAKFETLKVEGFEPALHGMRLPLKSFNKADSYYDDNNNYIIGPNDYDLIKRLWKAGSEHRKAIRQIVVWVNISAPRYFFQEWDTYKIGTAANSESTMHTLLREDFDRNNFEWPSFNNSDWDIEASFNDYIDLLKTVRDRANESKGQDKEYYHQILKGLLPESFIQKRTVSLNYETLATMYRQRKNHRLPQWSKDFVSWINTLPYPELITGTFDK